MSESSLLRDAGLKENVEVISSEFLRGANFTRGILTVFQSGFTEERLLDAKRQVAFATDVKTFEVIAAPELPGSTALLRFGILGAAVSAGMALDVSGRPKGYARITLKTGSVIEVRADRVRIDMMLKQWTELRQ